MWGFLYFIAGLICASFFNGIYSLIFISFTAIVFILQRKNIKLKNILCFVLLFSVGFSYFYFTEKLVFDKIPDNISKNANLTLKVVSKDDFGFTVKIKERKNKKAYIYMKDEDSISYGDNLIVKANVRKVYNRKNEERNRVRENLSKGIVYEVTNVKINKIIKGKNSIPAYLYNLKCEIRNLIKENFSKKSSSFLLGIITGDKNLPFEFKDAFRRTGISHVVVVSGMHFSILIMVLTFILRRLGIGRKLGAFISIIFAFIFAMFIGFSPSVKRAFIMIVILSFADIINAERKYDLRLLLLTATILVIYNPYIVFDVGFVLSFLSVAGILILNKRISQKLKFLPYSLANIISASLSANIFTFPYIVYIFKGFSLSFLISNIIILPFVTLYLVMGIITLLLLSFINPLGIIFARVVDFAISKTVDVLYFISSIPFSYIDTLKTEKAIILIYYMLLYLYLKYSNKVVRISIIIGFIISIIIPMFINISSFFTAEVKAFGSTNGGKVFIKYQNEEIFIDISDSISKSDIRKYIDTGFNNTIEHYVISGIYNLDYLKDNNFKVENLYCTKNVYENPYAKEICDKFAENVIVIDYNYKLKLSQLNLTLCVLNEYNISVVIIEKNNKKIFVTRTPLYATDNQSILTYSLLKTFNNDNFINSINNKVRGIKL